MFHTNLLQAQCGSPTSCKNNVTAFLERLVSGESKNGFRVLADDAKIGKTGAEYLIIFGARATETSAACAPSEEYHSAVSVFSEVVRKGDGEKGIFSSPSLSPSEEGNESYDRRQWMLADGQALEMHLNFIADG